MDWLSLNFLLPLVNIIIIDLVLAGDNALVIGMAARNLPKQHQKKAIIWGSVGAVVLRVAATLFVVALLAIPGLQLIGGLLLIWISLKLLIEKKHSEEVKAASNIWAAIRTIMIADAVMGIDNVLAIAGAASHNAWLVIIGLAISIPVVVWGSTLVIKLIDKFPFIIYIGAGVLAYTAAKMITEEPLLHFLFEGNPVMKWTLITIVIAAVLVIGRILKLRGDKPIDRKSVV